VKAAKVTVKVTKESVETVPTTTTTIVTRSDSLAALPPEARITSAPGGLLCRQSELS